MFYFDRMFPQTPDLDDGVTVSPVKILPQNEKQMYMDYRWRFSIQKPDDSWEFASSTTRTNLKLTILQNPKAADVRPSLTLVAHELTDEDKAQSLASLVQRSTQLLTDAGYVIESRKDDAQYQGFPASEIVLTYSYADLGVKNAPADENVPAPEANAKPETAALDTKHYMFIVMANDIEYILSFSTLRKDYAKYFPDLKMIANTFTPF